VGLHGISPDDARSQASSASGHKHLCPWDGHRLPSEHHALTTEYVVFRSATHCAVIFAFAAHATLQGAKESRQGRQRAARATSLQPQRACISHDTVLSTRSVCRSHFGPLQSAAHAAYAAEMPPPIASPGVGVPDLDARTRVRMRLLHALKERITCH